MARSASGPRVKPSLLERRLDEAIDGRANAARSSRPRAARVGRPARRPSGRPRAARLRRSAARGKPSAPCSIQRRSRRLLVGRERLLGLRRHLVARRPAPRARSRRASPGSTTGPLSPPRASDRGLERFSFPLGLIGPWHLMQRALRSGWTSRVEGRLRERLSGVPRSTPGRRAGAMPAATARSGRSSACVSSSWRCLGDPRRVRVYYEEIAQPMHNPRRERSTPMALAHVTLATRDLGRSTAFFHEVMGWTPIGRPTQQRTARRRGCRSRPARSCISSRCPSSSPRRSSRSTAGTSR